MPAAAASAAPADPSLAVRVDDLLPQTQCRRCGFEGCRPYAEAVAGHALEKEAGGLSGAPLTKASTVVLARLRSELDPTIPIIGSGGVMSAEDARAKFDAGAALVQVYTGLVYRGPRLVKEIAALGV